MALLTTPRSRDTLRADVPYSIMNPVKEISQGDVSLRQVFSAFALSLTSILFVTQSVAQDLTSPEIAERFRAQLRSIEDAQRDPSLGATRGLVLVPVAPTEAARDSAAQGGADATELTLNPDGGSTGGEEQAAVWTVPADERVDISVTFAFDSAALAPDQKAKLRGVCDGLLSAGVGVLKIVGHTDASGPWEYNQQLSELRAGEVKRYFVSDCGVPADRLEAIGVGEQMLSDPGNPRSPANRRVEFQAVS